MQLTREFSIACFAGLLLSGSCKNRTLELSPAVQSLSLPSVTMQQVQERIWRDVNLQLLFELSPEPDIVLYNPQGAIADAEGNIYVADLGDLTVKRFGPNGQYINSYGVGIGQGPGELSNLLDLGIIGDSIVFLLDNSDRKISFFDMDGAFRKSESLDLAPVKYVVTPKGRSYVLTSHTEFLFQTRMGETTTEFGLPQGPDRLPGPGLSAGMLATNGERLLFAPTYYPVLVQYNTDGAIHYARATPDWGRVREPYWQEARIGDSRGYRPIGDLVHGFLSVDEDRAYVTSYMEAEPVIDVYEVQSGDYVLSFSVPQSLVTYVKNGRVYQVDEEGVVAVYSIDVKE